MRFSKCIRLVISFLYILALLCYIPTVIYGPGLALNHVSRMNVHVVTPIVSTVCIIYTTLGGLKAVVWSDTLQGLIMVGAVIAVMFLGIKDVGGLKHIFEAGAAGDRLELFNMDPSPTTRLSFWSTTLGLFCLFSFSLGCSPQVVQRYISLPTLNQARNSALGLCFGGYAFFLLSCFTGLIIYAKYSDCDPLAAGVIDRADQILPLFVIDIAKDVKGLSGLFMAGIVSAALSTMSTGLNTLSGIIYEDFMEPFFSQKPTERVASIILKVLVVVVGVICVTLVALIEKLGPLVEVAQGFAGMQYGTMYGVFLLGLFFPSANSKGAFCGGMVSMIVMMWLMLGNLIATSNGQLKYSTRPMSTASCPNNITQPIVPTYSTNPPGMNVLDYFPLYNVTLFNYSLIGCSLVLIVALPVSFLTGGNKKKLDLNLLSPAVAYFYKNRKEYEYNTVQMRTY